ncbi:MAG: DUF4124 domain-containing protein [Betaproteobacteria bacterium]|nr:DUF4124 domain-containing protein [Betaproteobacteria bacterium]
MPAPRRILRATFCSFVLLTSALCPQAAQAQLYSWKDAEGNVTIKNVPPPWYRESERAPGPRVQVLRGGKVIDDTAWSAEKRQEGRTQSARQEAGRPAPDQPAEKRGPSTRDERAKIVRLEGALEQNLMNGIADSDRVWFTKLILDVPDIALDLGLVSTWCAEAVRKGQASMVLLQFMLSAAAFQIEDPTNAKDHEAVDLAGLEGVLRAYENLIKNFPSARTEKMDETLKLRAKGELSGFVKKLRAKTSS